MKMSGSLRQKLAAAGMCIFLLQALVFAEQEDLFLDKKTVTGMVLYTRIPVLSPERKRQEQYVFRSAAQLAMRNEIFVQYITDEDAVASVLTEYDQTDTLGVSAQLAVLEERNCGTYYEALLAFGDKKRFSSIEVPVSLKQGKDGNPAWVAKPPKGKKYEAFVSTVVSPPDPAEGFFLSDEWAIAGLATKVSEPVESGTFKKYEAVLRGAYIAARWYNEKTDTYYSLAVLPQ